MSTNGQQSTPSGRCSERCEGSKDQVAFDPGTGEVSVHQAGIANPAEESLFGGGNQIDKVRNHRIAPIRIA
jgi:hypothetical protein